jgi:hypothetical protein
MFIKVLFVGLLALLLGAAFCFAGYRFFRVLIAIWGFFAGFLIGASGVAVLFGGGFLATVLGWIIGVVVGLIIAAVAYFFYVVAVVILGASVGYWISIGLMSALGFSSQGFLTELVGIIAAIVLAILIIALNLPKVLIMVFTALGGASTILAGILLLIGQISLLSLQNGAVEAVIRNSWFWGLIWLVLAVIGFAVQWSSMHEYTWKWSQSQP